MAGQVCVAVAIRAEEVGAGGTIPLQGCDYLTMDRQFNDKSPVVNQALFNPDWSEYPDPREREKNKKKTDILPPLTMVANESDSLRHDGTKKSFGK